MNTTDLEVRVAADVKLPATIAKHSELRTALDACRERVLEVELARGETP